MTTPRILVVDDEPDLEPLILQKFRKRIRDGELEFTFARDGQDALAKINADPAIGIVFTDINMPVMDGLTLLNEVGGIRGDLKTVIVSAYDDMQNIRTAMNRGAFDFLTKPIDFRDFEATLDKTRNELETIRQSAHHREQLFALQNEISIAARIQQSILPREFPDHPRIEVFAQMQPARSVSGDFYDFFFVDPDHLAFAVGDVSGKGVPAAIYMAVSRTLVRATAGQKLSPEDCMAYVNHVLTRQGERDMFVTLFYGVMDVRNGTIDFCNAGHVPPWIVSPSSAEPVREVRGNMLGIFDDPELGIGKMQLAPGSSLFVPTDGVLEAENPMGEEWTSSGLEAALVGSHSESAEGVVQQVFRSVQQFAEGTPQRDDITLFAVRYRA